jgi:hypothetical protein
MNVRRLVSGCVAAVLALTTLVATTGPAAAKVIGKPIAAPAVRTVARAAVDPHNAALLPHGRQCGRVQASVHDGQLASPEEYCVSIGAASANQLKGLAPALRAANSGIESVWCFTMTDSTWWETRTSTCAILVINSELINSQTGAVLGTAGFLDAEEINLSAKATTWSEYDALYALSETGALIDTPIYMDVACKSPCSPPATAIFNGVPIAAGQTLVAVTAYSDSPAPGPDTMNNSYSFTPQPAGTVTLTPATWTSPNLRCDKLVGTTAGCVVPGYIPILDLSIQRSGAGAAFVQWAQLNLSGHWGLEGAVVNGVTITGSPLRRLANATEQKANRTTICQDGSFTADPNIYQDTCDEFPFAATYESGALNGVTTGAACAQGTAVASPTTPPAGTLPPVLKVSDVAGYYPSFKIEGTPTKTEACLRSHSPQQLNSDVGGQLGNFTQNERLLDNDQYWVSVTQNPVVVVGG